MSKSFPTKEEIADSIRKSTSGVLSDDETAKILDSLDKTQGFDQQTSIPDVTFGIQIQNGDVSASLGVPSPYNQNFAGSGANSQNIDGMSGSGSLVTADTDTLFSSTTMALLLNVQDSSADNLGFILLSSTYQFLGTFTSDKAVYPAAHSTTVQGGWSQPS